MPYGFIMETPLSPQQYDELNGQVGPDPDGLIVHIAAKGAGGMRIIDVWESKEAFERFQTEMIMPAMEGQGMGAEGPDEPPPMEELEIHNVRTPGN